VTAKKLMREGKYEEALGIIKDFEKKVGISDEDKLSALMLEGRLYVYTMRLQKAVDVGEPAYNLSLKLGNTSSTIEALLIKSNIGRLGKFDNALELIQEAELLIDSLERETNSELPRERANASFIKAWIYNIKGKTREALELALEALTQGEKIKNNIMVAYNLYLVGNIYYSKNNLDLALDHATKGLELQNAMNNSAGIAAGLGLIAWLYFSKGDIDMALQLCDQALGFNEISTINKFLIFFTKGNIYRLKGELDRALKYHEQALALSETLDYKHTNVAGNWVQIGNIYRMKGDYDKAISFLKRIVESKDETHIKFHLRSSLFWLVLINLDKNFPEEVQRYLSQLEEISNKTESKITSQTYKVAKAIVLKKSGRTRNRFESENLLKEIVEGEILEPDMYIQSLVSLCEYFLEELELSNEPEVLDEINPYITRLLEFAEKQNSYSILAETKLLQGRLALMRLNLDDVRQFLTSAQKIADEHGLRLLAQKISHEHDNLLEELETWQSFKKTKASISKRMKMAAVEGVIKRMQGKKAVDPPELVNEEPILLLIMDSSGVPYFNHSFVSNWDIDGIFSSFMSAFNTFSSELFSKSIDRIRIGENTILINPIDSFLACYVIKGQSFPALHKLTRFTEAIRDNLEIWQALNTSTRTSEMLELERLPALKTVINEIFT